MKFLVMLAVLALRNFYGYKITLPLDNLFKRWQEFWVQRLQQGWGSSSVFLASLLSCIFVLWLILWLIQDWYWGVPALFIHLLVVIYALGRRCDLVWIEKYMQAWRQGDTATADRYAQEILTMPLQGKSRQELHEQVISRLIVLAFDRLFLVLFWYLLLGPAGALMARLTEQAITNAQRINCTEQVLRFQQVMHWPAGRLMGLTLGLVTRPWQGLVLFMRDIWRWRLSTEEFLNRQLQVCAYPCVELMTEAGDEQLLDLRERIWRSLAVWVALAALGVILGF